MHSTHDPRNQLNGDSWSVFAAFRRTRLALARRLPSLEVALTFAERVRRDRFHDPGAVFIVHDQSGQAVDERQRSNGGTDSADATSEPSASSPRVHDERFRTSIERAERALERARETHARVAREREVRITMLRSMPVIEPASLRLLEDRRARLADHTAAAIQSMADALGVLRR